METYHLIKDEFKNNEKILTKYLKYDGNLSTWLTKTEEIEKKIHKSAPFCTYKKSDLYELVTSSTRSLYERCLMNKHSEEEMIAEYVFRNMSNEEKIGAILEKLYVETINEYIIPELEIYNRMPKDINNLFMNTYMNYCSGYYNFSMINYAIENYNEIMARYSEKIISVVFKHCVDNKLIYKI